MNRLHRAIDLADGKPLLGAAVYFYDPVFLEMAALLGFKAIWIEMEHAAITFAEAADLCRMAAGSGMLTMIRIADTSRNSVLKAAECGPDIIDIPMADDAVRVSELIRYARFAPVGARGFFSVSRALKYGLVDSVPSEQQKLNEELSLLAQIESKEALSRIEEICSIKGVDIFCATHLATAVANGSNAEARAGMSLASLYGGLCLGPVNTAAVHALAYPLGGEFHLAHGLANAILLPAVFRFNASAAPARHADVARALGAPSGLTERATAATGGDLLATLTADCGLACDLGLHGVTRKDIPSLASSAITVTRLLKNNPRPISLADAEDIYTSCFGAT